MQNSTLKSSLEVHPADVCYGAAATTNTGPFASSRAVTKLRHPGAGRRLGISVKLARHFLQNELRVSLILGRLSVLLVKSGLAEALNALGAC